MSFRLPGKIIGLKFIPSHLELFRYLYPSQCESFRTNPKNALYLVWCKTVKNQSDLIRLIPRQQSALIRTNPKPSFQSRSIRIFIRNQSEWIQGRNYSDWFWLKIRIENLVSDCFWLMRIVVSELIGSSRIDFLPFFIKQDTKRFSDWFGIIRIGLDTDIRMNRNSSDWLGMNFNPILSPGFLLQSKFSCPIL